MPFIPTSLVYAVSQSFDVIIVGGGAAGCVIASRLSADSRLKVLLVEAGGNLVPGREPDDILDTFPGKAYLNKSYSWPDFRVSLGAEPLDGSPPKMRVYEQARVLGGGSSINGAVAVRGSSDDYDEWQEMGAVGWNWAGVLPYFRRLEKDMDFSGVAHGDAGPIPIRRIFPDGWDGLAAATGRAFAAHGFSYIPDMNDGFREGYSPAPFNNAYGRRVSTAMGYLGATVRQRPNLKIATDTTVERIVFEGRRATGVEMRGSAGTERASAREIVLCCGAIRSPALLQRSGVGPAALLERLGIDVVADRPGVGEGLQDHVAVSITAYLPPHARFDPVTRRHVQLHLRYSSGVEGCPPADMIVNTLSRSAWHPLGLQLGTFQIFTGKTFSRGKVRIADARADGDPAVFMNILSDERDLRRLMGGVRMMARIAASPALAGVAVDAFPSSYSEEAQRFGKLTLSNRILTQIAAIMMDGPPAIRRWFISRAITRGASLAGLLSSDEALERFVRQNATSTWHPSCSCAMGWRENPLAVTDPGGRVYGVEGLRVGDASIMPAVPRANTHIPTIMIGEKIADAVQADLRVPA